MVLWGDGTGQLAGNDTFAINNTRPRSVAVGDFDGDGAFDLAVGSDTSDVDPTVSILLGDGARGFPISIDGVQVSLGSAAGLVAADLDGDGRADLAGTNSSGSSISVLLTGP